MNPTNPSPIPDPTPADVAEFDAIASAIAVDMAALVCALAARVERDPRDLGASTIGDRVARRIAVARGRTIPTLADRADAADAVEDATVDSVRARAIVERDRAGRYRLDRDWLLRLRGALAALAFGRDINAYGIALATRATVVEARAALDALRAIGAVEMRAGAASLRPAARRALERLGVVRDARDGALAGYCGVRV